jgi:hypothetical protein
MSNDNDDSTTESYRTRATNAVRGFKNAVTDTVRSGVDTTTTTATKLPALVAKGLAGYAWLSALLAIYVVVQSVSLAAKLVSYPPRKMGKTALDMARGQHPRTLAGFLRGFALPIATLLILGLAVYGVHRLFARTGGMFAEYHVWIDTDSDTSNTGDDKPTMDGTDIIDAEADSDDETPDESLSA